MRAHDDIKNRKWRQKRQMLTPAMQKERQRVRHSNFYRNLCKYVCVCMVVCICVSWGFVFFFKRLRLSRQMILAADDDADDDVLRHPLDPSCSSDSMKRDIRLDTSSSLDFEIETFERRIQRYLRKRRRSRSFLRSEVRICSLSYHGVLLDSLH